jgi:hypothetical protein
MAFGQRRSTARLRRVRHSESAEPAKGGQNTVTKYWSWRAWSPGRLRRRPKGASDGALRAQLLPAEPAEGGQIGAQYRSFARRLSEPYQ